MIAAAGFVALFFMMLIWSMCRAAATEHPTPPVKRVLLFLAAKVGGRQT